MATGWTRSSVRRASENPGSHAKGECRSSGLHVDRRVPRSASSVSGIAGARLFVALGVRVWKCDPEGCAQQSLLEKALREMQLAFQQVQYTAHLPLCCCCTRALPESLFFYSSGTRERGVPRRLSTVTRGLRWFSQGLIPEDIYRKTAAEFRGGANSTSASSFW